MRPIIAITMGDPAGIGPEIVVKALGNAEVYRRCTPVVLGAGCALGDAVGSTNSRLLLKRVYAPEEAAGQAGTLEYIESEALDRGSYKVGEVSAVCGGAAYRYIVEAIGYAKDSRAAAVVTGPINKEALRWAGIDFPGHTEIFAHFTNTADYAMMLASGNLRVIHVTTHEALRDVADLLTAERVYKTIALGARTLESMGIRNGRIAVAGFNPHASEGGLFGDEERLAIAPAVGRARGEGIDAAGPLPPDSIFARAMGGEFDLVVAMYHDQGHIPLKLAGFRMDPATGEFTDMSGINITVGLPIIRTSVDHGTAFDRAGRGTAHEGSMLEAIFAAIDMAAAAGDGVC